MKTFHKYLIVIILLFVVGCIIAGCSDSGMEGYRNPNVAISPWSLSHPPEYTVHNPLPPYYYGGDEPVGSFPVYKDPIFPDIAQYACDYWPRVGRLGSGLFEGWPPAATAY